MKSSHCDECKHATVKWYEYKGPPAFDVLTCAKKHKPRHYMPRNAMDTDYGWKRVCADFETHNDLGNRRDAGPIGGASVLTDGLAGKRTE